MSIICQRETVRTGTWFSVAKYTSGLCAQQHREGNSMETGISVVVAVIFNNHGCVP